MLSSLLRSTPKSTSHEPDAEDYFQSSLGLVFTDDLQNQHGDPETYVTYRSNGYGDLDLEIADPQGETERTKFAHYLWNAGVLMAELVGGRAVEGRCEAEGEQWGQRSFAEGREWWVDHGDEEKWRVDGETVIELGAGVGLAGIMSTLAGAQQATITDYPAESILETLKHNVSKTVPDGLKAKITVEGHKWGDFTTPFAASHGKYFTRVIAADTLWLSSEHGNLATSMLHFLSDKPSARVFVVAGFHTGRARMAAFFEEAVPEHGLEIEDIFEMDADGRRRSWQPHAPEEAIGERKKWLVVARLKRSGPRQQGNLA